MQRLEVSGAVRPIYGSLGVKRLKVKCVKTIRLHTLSTAPHTDRQCVSAVCRKEMTKLQAFTHKCKIQLFCVNSVAVMLY